MKVTFLGTGVAIPTKERVQSGILLTEPFILLFDCGSGVLGRIAQAGYNHTDIDTVFFTHHHLDHDSDFIALVKANWLRGKNEFSVYGPIGTQIWVHGLLELYPYLKGKVDIEVNELKDCDTIILNGLKIKAREVIHSLPTLSYRIEGESTFIFSGDTEPCSGVEDFCKKGAELLIHECSFPDGFDVTNHTTPRSLGEMIKGLPIKKVVLTHLYPETKGFEDQMKKRVKANFLGDVLIAHDLLTIEF